MNFKDYQKLTEVDYSAMNVDMNVDMNEATFNTKDMAKVSNLLAKIASKKLGANFQLAWIDKFKKSNGDTGIGYRYISVEGKQIRFGHLRNNKGGFSINIVDYWKKGAALTEPSITLRFNDDVNIVQVKDQIFDAIKTGKVKPISRSMLEATAKERKASRMAFTKEYGIDDRNGKISDRLLTKAAAAAGLEDEYKDWMSVTTNQSEKTEIGDTIKKDEKEVKKIYADPDVVFDDIESLLELVAHKKWRSMIVCGQGGIGKTWHITEGPKSLKSIIGPQGVEWILHTATKAAPFSFYKTLFQERDRVIVFDEADSLLGNKEIIMMLKGLLDTSGDKNFAEYMSGTQNMIGRNEAEIEDYCRAVDDELADGAVITMGKEKPGEVKLPSKFEFSGSMIFISNMPAGAINKAVMSRSIFFDVYLAAQDLIKRVRTIGQLKVENDPDVTQADLDLVMDALGSSTGEPIHDIQYMTPELARKSKQVTLRALDLGLLIATSKTISQGDKKRLIGLYA